MTGARTLVAVVAGAFAGLTAHARLAMVDMQFASNVVMPQSRAFVTRPDAGRVEITLVDVRAEIAERVATTRMDISLSNPTNRTLEAELLVPVPDGAVVRGFDFQGAGVEPSARLLPKDEARRTYDAIVARTRDPALLEFAAHAVVRSSVFPVPPRGTQRVRITYENVVESRDDRIAYMLPRTESLALATVPWRITATVGIGTGIATVYSPTHEIVTTRHGAGSVTVRTGRGAEKAAGPFRLFAVLERGDVAASLMAYPTAEGGYFLLVLAPPGALDRSAMRAIPREVTLVLDRSGSMAGGKMESAVAAARQVVEGLGEGEAFNIIDYSSSVSLFAARPVRASRRAVVEARRYLERIRPRGGTNIHDATMEALRQPAAPGRLGMVLMLTDGLPTVGITRETIVRKSLFEANAHGRRIFTIGVGYDVNAPLLTALAETSRGTATFVSPDEDVEVKVARVFERLHGPVLAGVELDAVDVSGDVDTRAVSDLLPRSMPDMYASDHVVVLGRYRGNGPLSFRLAGNYLGSRRRFRFTFPLKAATTRNAFVPRLWASRRIALLTEAIRQLGAEEGARPAALGRRAGLDPQLKELVDEIVRLSTEFGILTEYTSFFAREGTGLTEEEAFANVERNLREKAVMTRVGSGSVSQSANYVARSSQSTLNLRNTYLDEKMRTVRYGSVQQVADRAFFRRGGRWLDARLMNSGAEADRRVERRVAFGSPRYLDIARRLASEGRGGLLALNSTGPLDVEIDGERVVLEAAQ